jgi:glutamate dehydrogenase (NADP+)
MPTVPEGIDIFHREQAALRPGQGGQCRRRVGVRPGDDPEQHALSWTREEVDTRLQMIMKSIHQTCLDAAEQYGTPGNYMNGRQHRRLRQGGGCHDRPGRGKK